MENQKINLKDTQQFSSLFLDYIDNKEELKSFFNLYPTINSFEKQIQQKRFSEEHRKNLVSVLKEQYSSVSNAPSANIEALANENTFTVTTGHQLNIFSGPLYFIYKIVTVINLSKELKAKYPDYNFVPVYWMATEDHDFEEIASFNLFGKKYTWETEQKGGVGRMSLEGIDKIWEEVSEMPEFFKKAYTENKTLAEATRAYVNYLFGKEGLVVVDADSSVLKKEFASSIADDLLNHTANNLVEKQNSELEKLGYKTQIFPRKINFFYLDNGIRERIEKQEDGSYQVLNTEITFSEQELQQKLETSPECFSPNVVMRPVYQEVILPNLAYIGGPAEVVYWLQLKPVFDHYNIPFPILMPRNFALVVNKGNAKKINKLGVSTEVFFQDEDTLRLWFVEKNAETSFELSHEMLAFKKVFKEISTKAEGIDPSLVGFVGAETQKGLKSLQNIEKRLRKGEERKQETAVKQLLGVKERLFPNGSPQERVDNLLTFHLNDESFIQTLLEEFKPLEFTMNVMIHND